MVCIKRNALGNNRRSILRNAALRKLQHVRQDVAILRVAVIALHKLTNKRNHLVGIFFRLSAIHRKIPTSCQPHSNRFVIKQRRFGRMNYVGERSVINARNGSKRTQHLPTRLRLFAGKRLLKLLAKRHQPFRMLLSIAPNFARSILARTPARALQAFYLLCQYVLGTIVGGIRCGRLRIKIRCFVCHSSILSRAA